MLHAMKVAYEPSQAMYRESRERLLTALREHRGLQSGLLYFEGNHETYKNETDHELPFR